MFKRKEVKKPSLFASLLIFLFLIGALFAQVIINGSADAHITFLLTIAFGAIVLLINGNSC